MTKRLLTVAEFSAQSHISKQRVYQLVKRKLAPYVQKIDGKTMISETAFEVMDFKDLEQVVEQEEKTAKTIENTENSSGAFKGVEQELTKTLNNTIETLNHQVEILQKQIEVKDRQIESLSDALKAEQILHGAKMQKISGTSEDERTKDEPRKKRNFFDRLLHRNRGQSAENLKK